MLANVESGVTWTLSHVKKEWLSLLGMHVRPNQFTNLVLWKYGVTDTAPTSTGYYGYKTEVVVVELTLIFL